MCPSTTRLAPTSGRRFAATNLPGALASPAGSGEPRDALTSARDVRACARSGISRCSALPVEGKHSFCMHARPRACGDARRLHPSLPCNFILRHRCLHIGRRHAGDGPRPFAPDVASPAGKCRRCSSVVPAWRRSETNWRTSSRTCPPRTARQDDRCGAFRVCPA